MRQDELTDLVGVGALPELAALTAAFGGQPQLQTLAEFDELMDDDALTLVLDPDP